MISVDPRRKKQLDFIGITEIDLSYLKSKQGLLEQITELVVDKLYQRLIDEPELAKIIQAHSSLERLKQTQRWYFRSMADGMIDNEYIDRRLYIGKLHSRIGLTTDWYLGTYILYLDITASCLLPLAPDECIEIIRVLTKMFNLDAQIVLEAYEQDEKEKIRQMADEKEHMLLKIQSAVQELAEMMAKLHKNSQIVEQTSAHSALLQEQTASKVVGFTESVHNMHTIAPP
ncbi:protoglobin domain-containing protein [Paenibacillus sp. DMB20]|uniref:protoglobin domain-containing protein n=1 Tax=Paenibacillus sp. DMB20 TaxID=1642570 RepID=UPI000AC85F1D|nr:protoglobin domain-containing protein [Paenibacillus sp. DMB20]